MGEPLTGSIIDIVRGVSWRNSIAPAVITSDESVSHGTLYSEVDRLAERLATAGVGAGSRVALDLDPGIDEVVSLLALASLDAYGAPGSSVDNPSGPLSAGSDAAAGIVLGSARGEPGERILVHGRADGATEPDPAGRPDRALLELPGSDEAEPVLRLTQEAVVRTVLAVNRLHRIGSRDRVLAVTSLSSERTVYSIVGLLAAGGAVVVPDPVERRNPVSWAAACARHGVSVWNAPPGLTSTFVTYLGASEEGFDGRAILLSGEPADTELVLRARKVCSPDTTISYLGAGRDPGVWSTCWTDDGGELEPGWVPIGAALPGRRVAIMAADRAEESPLWVTGRVHAGDEGGDDLRPTPQFGRLRPDGVIEYMGDVATRYLVHGHPLNLRSVEAALADHPAVQAAAVVALPEREQLVGYAVPAADGAGSVTDVTGEMLHDHLRRKVSPYLLPSLVRVTFALPLTAEGTVDRAALADAGRFELGGARPETESPEEPDELVTDVADIAARLLGVRRVEPNTNLMDLGATSLDLVRLATAVEDELGHVVDIEQLLQFPSVAVLVSRLRSESPLPVTTAAPADVAEPSLSPPRPQDRVAFTDRQLGIRHRYDSAVGAPMSGIGVDRMIARRTHRRFGPEPVGLETFGALVGALREIDTETGSKRWYPSAGSTFAVQVFVVIRSGAVLGIAGGSYYHHPRRNVLVSVTPMVAMDPARHDETNRRAAEEAAFAVHLVGRTDAITPLYGDRSLPYMLVEAGAMVQVLMGVAAEVGLGLCPIAAMDPDDLVGALELDEHDALLHTVVGGTIAEP